MAKEIVIVGAGFAGVAAARKLGKKYKKDKTVNITLVDRHSYLTYMTELHEIAGGRLEPDAIKYDLRRIFHRLNNVKLVTDNVSEIDHDNNVVIGEQSNYKFDYLVLAVGAEPNDFGIDGVKENGFTLWSMEDAERVREHIIDMVYKAAREHDPVKRRALLSFLVCGGGFTGVEMIGELVEWLPILAEEHKLNPDEISFHLVEAAPKILNTVTEKEQERAMKYMRKKGIDITLGDGIAKIADDHIELASGKKIDTYTSIWTAGIKANTDASEWGVEQARAGRLVADQYMQAKGYDNVFVAGDLVYYEDPTNNNMPTPQIVQAAELTGDVAATTIISEISGTEKEEFEGKYDGNMVSIGSTYGVAYLYDKYSVQGFIAMFIKHAANVIYFLSIGSFYYAWLYVRHEFFTIKHKRNIFRGHLSAHGNILWSVPLRLFYGAMWLVEGLKKTFGMFGGQSWFEDEVVFPFPWLQEEVTSAASATETEEVVEVAEQIFSLNYVYGEEPMLVFDEMPGWFASIMEFMMPNQDVALFMQKMMSLVELGIGLALIAGLFTFLVSGLTVVLVAMFCLSGMFVWVNMWFIPAAIALMMGAGRAFGLDYYVMPWLGKLFDGWIWGKPKHIYTDNIG
ncbi:NADH dehydrogenase FAD-containing subunit [Ruoffia tabacinasalis]|uniref:NADH:ubiquinone reductase (non-electrogenic) n=1 Tax=Ruoffia tabacinasalis TaxID=87458 RepID=A0A5R9DYE9_9LACT|nr:FAD-dependent oxidoreductase [Ruoffia tabacinasalis]TLQ40183.1 NADH dehydrogenase FAD-containing subunit [Ruoffia tabacinasalis]